MINTVFIAVPSMDMCPIEFASSLARLDKPCHTYLQVNKGSLIYGSRNSLAEDAINSGADAVIWFDSDMQFPRDTITRMLEHLNAGADIVTGVYFRRVGTYAPVIFKGIEKVGENAFKAIDYDDFPRDRLFEVAACGFGCVAMKTEVLKNIGEKFGKPFTPIMNAGEDVSFCIRAYKAGYRIIADPSIKLGHIGYHIVDSNFYDSFRAATAAELRE